MQKGYFMNVNKKIVTIGATLGCIILYTNQTFASAQTDTKTYYDDVNIATVYNDEDSDMIHVVNIDDMDAVLFKMKTIGKYVYTNIDNLNIRISPNIVTSPYASLPIGTKLLLVGESNIGWSLVQIDGVNYFVWNEFLTENTPDNPIENFNLSDYIYDEYKSVNEPNVSDAETNESVLTSLGVWSITGYCPCVECCGQWSGSNTASGAQPTSNHTLATNELPFGTQLLINGIVYTVEDRGNSPYYPWADIYFDTHEQANAWGLQQVEVFMIS